MSYPKWHKCFLPNFRRRTVGPALAALCCASLLAACGAAPSASPHTGSSSAACIEPSQAVSAGGASTENPGTDKAGKPITVVDGVPYVQEEDGELVQLGEAIAPPEEWTGQDLAGRNTAATLLGEPDVQGQFVSDTSGWLIACYDRGDVYIYKTADGGATWTEVAKPDFSNSVLRQAGFLSSERLIVTGDLFTQAPVLITRDGGQTWQAIETPDPMAAVSSILVDGQEVTLEFEECGGVLWRMTSPDLGDTWTSEPL